MERQVRLTYPNAEGDIADDLVWDSFVVSLGVEMLQQWVCQACPRSFAEARPVALKGSFPLCGMRQRRDDEDHKQLWYHQGGGSGRGPNQGSSEADSGSFANSGGYE